MQQLIEKGGRMYGQSVEEAKAFVQKAIDFYKKAGKAIAMAEFTNPKGPFIKDDMYVFVLNLKGTMLSHGVNEKYIGHDFIDLKDSDGRSFVREIVDVANVKGKGTADYKWYNPKTKEDLAKAVYFEKVDDVIICSGIYKEMWQDLL
jgi:cytochrome c